MSDEQRIAEALEELVSKAIRDFEFGLNVLKLPDSVRAPMWTAIARRAIEKAVRCETQTSSMKRNGR